MTLTANNFYLYKVKTCASPFDFISYSELLILQVTHIYRTYALTLESHHSNRRNRTCTLWFFSNATVWNDVAQWVYIVEGRVMSHLITLEKLFMAWYLILLIWSMILYCANINFYHEISDAKNLMLWFPIFESKEVWIIQRSTFLHQFSYAVHS